MEPQTKIALICSLLVLALLGFPKRLDQQGGFMPAAGPGKEIRSIEPLSGEMCLALSAYVKTLHFPAGSSEQAFSSTTALGDGTIEVAGRVSTSSQEGSLQVSYFGTATQGSFSAPCDGSFSRNL